MNNMNTFPYSTVKQRIARRVTSRKFKINGLSDWGLINMRKDPNKILALRYGISTIGRHSAANFISISPLSSRLQAIIEVYEDSVIFSDLSCNGSIIHSGFILDVLYSNDREIKDGDVISFHTEKFKLVKLNSFLIED